MLLVLLHWHLLERLQIAHLLVLTAMIRMEADDGGKACGYNVDEKSGTHTSHGSHMTVAESHTAHTSHGSHMTVAESIRGKPRHNNKKCVKDAQDACEKQVVCPSLDCSAMPRILDLCLSVIVVAVSGTSMTATASGT